MDKGRTVTVRNVTQMSPEDIYIAMRKMYDNIMVTEAILGPQDLEAIIKLLGWCTNQKSYLSSLGVYLDIATRNAKKSGNKDAYSDMVCRKNIVNRYYDQVDGIYKASSRQATLYMEQQKELDDERRIHAVQKGWGGQ